MKFDLLHNFISPVTGRVLSDTDYILIGDLNGIATPSPILIDIRLELINLRHDVNTIASADFVIGFPNLQLPKAQVLSKLEDGFIYNTDGVISTSSGGLMPPLAPNQMFIGNSENVATPTNLGENQVFIGDGSNINATDIIDLMPPLSPTQMYIGNSSNQPTATELGSNEVFLGTGGGISATDIVSPKYLIFDTSYDALPNAVSMALTSPGAILTRSTLSAFGIASFFVLPKRMVIGAVIGVSGTPDTLVLENNEVPIGNGVTIEAKDISSVAAPRDAKYIIQTADSNLPNAQALTNLQDGLVKKINGGALAHAVVGEDYMGMDLATDRLWIGNAEGKATQVTTIKIDNLPDLAQGKIHVGNASNRPVESDVLKAKFVIFDTSQDDLPNAVSLSSVEDGFLAKSSNSIVAATITYQKLLTGDSSRKIIEIDKIPYVNYADLQTDYLLTGDEQNRPSQILTIKLKNMPPLASGKMYFGNSDTVPQIIGLQEKYLFTGDSGGNISSVLRLDIDNYVNLTNNHIHIGNEQNRPIEKNITEVAAPRDAKYIIQSPDTNLPNAQALDALIGTEPKMLKASSSGVIQVATKSTDYVIPSDLDQIKTDIENLQQSLEQVQQDITNLTTQLNEFKGEYEAKVIEIEARLDALQLQLEALQGELAVIVAQVETLEVRVDGIIAGLAALTEVVADLGITVGGLVVSVGTLQLEVAGIGISLLTLTTKLNNLETETFIVQSLDAPSRDRIPNAQALADLEAIGILKTSLTGVISLAVGGQDFGRVDSVSGTNNQIIVSNTSLLPTYDITYSAISIADNPILPGTQYTMLPQGAIANRPASPTNGMIRFNTDTTKLEIYY